MEARRKVWGSKQTRDEDKKSSQAYKEMKDVKSRLLYFPLNKKKIAEEKGQNQWSKYCKIVQAKRQNKPLLKPISKKCSIKAYFPQTNKLSKFVSGLQAVVPKDNATPNYSHVPLF